MTALPSDADADTRPLNRRVDLRLSDEEFAMLGWFARQNGLVVSTAIRHCIRQVAFLASVESAGGLRRIHADAVPAKAPTVPAPAAAGAPLPADLPTRLDRIEAMCSAAFAAAALVAASTDRGTAVDAGEFRGAVQWALSNVRPLLASQALADVLATPRQER